MIITEQKPIDQIKSMVKPFNKVFIIGCGTCSTTCLTGGAEQVKEMASKLAGKKMEVIGTVVVEAPCDSRLLKRDTREKISLIKEADAVLCMACGAGVQNVAEKIGKIIVPMLDTKFIGKTERIGQFFERCRACGECILFETGGICPVSRCPKNMLNGPCGGMYKGKCEVGNYEKDCVWVIIYDRLKKDGRLRLFNSFKSPRDFSRLDAVPRESVWVKGVNDE